MILPDFGQLKVHRVVAAVIQNNEKVWVFKRPSGVSYGGKWEFPGGKVERGESIERTITRELSEELGISNVVVGLVLSVVKDLGLDLEITFVEVETDERPVLREHVDMRQVDRSELHALAMPPADREFVREWSS